jgi:signal transduction histidine kinase
MAQPPAQRSTPSDRRELLLGAGLSLALSTGLQLPNRLMGGDFGGLGWPLLGHALWLWTLWGAALLGQRWLPESDAERPRGIAVQVVVLALLSPTFGTLLGLNHGGPLPHNLYDLQVQASFTAFACLTVEYRQRRRRGEADAESLSHDALGLARQLDEARSALLQAQIEPHFLFNTLAHLRRLAQIDAPAAREMLGDLRRYLAAALPDLRQTQTTLARELELVRAFLALHQRRIGPERLQLIYEIAPGLDDIPVPSTCLLTLAENAVKHGITPQVEGGAISVRAGPDPDRPRLLRLEVADTGAGMSATTGGGTGLVTLRARIAALHGADARLSLHLNQPRGLIARVQLPWP